jgi:hypothetical protein
VKHIQLNMNAADRIGKAGHQAAQAVVLESLHHLLTVGDHPGIAERRIKKALQPGFTLPLLPEILVLHEKARENLIQAQILKIIRLPFSPGLPVLFL